VVEVVENLERFGAFAIVVRSLIGVAALVCWVVSGAVGGLDVAAGLLLAVVALAAMTAPDSAAPTVLIMTMAGSWMLDVNPFSVGWSLVLAACVLVVHVASARAATLARGTAFDPVAAFLWARQLAVVVAATVLVWLVVVRLQASPGTGALAVSAAALVLVAGLAVALTRWTFGSDHDQVDGAD
jgi:hypothetical protein